MSINFYSLKIILSRQGSHYNTLVTRVKLQKEKIPRLWVVNGHYDFFKTM